MSPRPLLLAFIGVLCVESIVACDRKSNGEDEAKPNVSVSSQVSSPAVSRPPATPEAVAPPSAPAPSTPKAPPQIVACGEHEVYRITVGELQVIETTREELPANIRGSRVARQVHRVEIPQPTNVMLLGKKVVVIAPDRVVQYDHASRQVQKYASIDVPSPLFAWAGQSSPSEFLVRGAGTTQLRHFRLTPQKPPAPTSDPAPPPPKLEVGAVDELAQADARLFAISGDGSPLYSTARGLAGSGVESPLPSLPQAVTVIWADQRSDRYWAADASGNVGLFARSQSKPLLSAQVPGVVVDASVEGKRTAVLSLALEAQSYLPTVTVFEDGKQQKRLQIGPRPASLGRPELDLCLLPDRPWVVVGGRDWLQLLDWSSPRLLAEW